VTLTHLLAGVAGLALVLTILWDAFETILVPRRIGRRVRLTRYFYILTWRLWQQLALRVRKTTRREGVLGFYGPLSLIVLLFCWAFGLITAFALLELACSGVGGGGERSFGALLYMSGETFFTLGFGDITPTTTVGRWFSVVEAGLGFGFLGTVVGYLPTMYGAFSQREIEISLMDGRAGSPPTAAEFLRRTAVSGRDDLCDEILAAWERWSAQLLETHISYPQLAYYRSQHSNQSWLGALTVILDSTSLILARGGMPEASQAQLTFAMARHALVDITQIFVRSLPDRLPDRLTPEALRALHDRLAGTPLGPPADEEYLPRLAQLRRMYEPYAQALAARLMFPLPPWAHDGPRRDNWQGGPWDKLLSARPAAVVPDEDHF
jgi:Ion channel